MRLQIRLLLVMAFALLFAGGALALQHKLEVDRSKQVLNSEIAQRKRYFNANLTMLQQPLLTLARDYSFWDEMVNFVKTKNKTFAKTNIDSGLSTFEADAAWVFDKSGNSIYDSQADPKDRVVAPKLTRSFFDDLDQSKAAHYFYKDGDELVEVRAATIVPSDDPEHKQPASGYWLVARRIDDDYLQRLTELSQASLLFDSPNATTKDLVQYDTVSFATPLPDVNGQPLAILRSTYQVPLVADLNRSYMQELLLLAFVGIGLVLVASIVIWAWVVRPVRRITRSIEQQNPDELEPLLESKSELGSLARTVRTFFEQKLTIDRAETEKAELEQLNAEKTAFLGAAAHELKGPITIVRLLSEGLPKALQPSASSTKITDQLATIINQTGKMSTIINDLRLASQGNANLEYTPKAVNFDDFLRKEIAANQLITEQTIEFDGGTGQTIELDPERFSQVVSNLIRNASKYAPDSGRITVRSSFEDDAIKLEVQDYGIGISEDDQTRIFERYYRSPDVTQHYQGLGLGLSICSDILARAGGTITVHSQSGEGSTFTITLPVQAG